MVFLWSVFPLLVQDNTSLGKPVLWLILGCVCKTLITNYFQQTAEGSGCWCISVKYCNIWRGPFTCVVWYGMVARQEKVTIINLPPHTTDLLQPLDVAVFKSLKDHWGDISIQPFRMFRNKLTDSEFGAVLSGEDVWKNALTTENVKQGF